MESITGRGSRGRGSSGGSGRGLGLLIRPALGICWRGKGSVDAGLSLDSIAGKADINPLR